MDPSRADELILLSLTREIGSEEAEELRLWTESSEAAMSYYRAISDLWQAAGAARITDQYNARKAFLRFRRQYLSRKDIRPHFGGAKLWRVAAALALLLATGILSWWRGTETVKQQFADIVINAPVGSSTHLTLPDGSSVWLNAASSIRYSQGFGVSDRRILLSGEGWFEVAHNEKLPFIVASDNLRVRALGTQFNFRDYPKDLEAVVSLKQGRIALTNLLISDTEKYLYPDQRVVMDKHTGMMHIESKDASKSMLWTDGVLFFDEELLPDIAKELERRYNVHITILGEQLRKMRIYGNFASRDLDIRDILDQLAGTNHLSYTMDAKEIILQ